MNNVKKNTKMNRNKIIISLVIAILITIITCIPIFAVSPKLYYLEMVPDDLGNALPNNYTNFQSDILVKYYIKINNLNSGFITHAYINDNGQLVNTSMIDIIYTNGTLTIEPLQKNTIYSYFTAPYLTINTTSTDIYIPIYCYNCNPYVWGQYGIDYTIYSSTITDEDILRKEYFEYGYAAGYNTGYDDGLYDGQNLQPNLNLVQHVEQLIGQFTGQEYARYITPVALVLTILLIYFLFIRFLLSLIKAKGVIKVCDITVLVAMIIILVIMYSPMLDLTIKNETIESTETYESTQVRNVNYIYDQYGRIIAGPGGTIIYDDVETTTSEQEQTDVDSLVSTSEETEIIEYEKKN